MSYVSELRKSPIQATVLLVGMWFTFGNYVAGTIIWPDTITDPNSMHMKDVLGFIPVMVNGWHLYFHLLTGLILLWSATSRRSAALASVLIGAAYLIVGGVGLVIDGEIFGFIMADTFGSQVHVIEGVVLVGAALIFRGFSKRPLLVA